VNDANIMESHSDAACLRTEENVLVSETLRLRLMDEFVFFFADFAASVQTGSSL